jgi:hypothetical protein
MQEFGLCRLSALLIAGAAGPYVLHVLHMLPENCCLA